ncbi:WhiB family transcriptional regulator [Streptomyces sp. HUCO-GS316]|uniref:WhiB family transcriptional regulator n=1 Tax=Streptomyces sp. HUCO-GS316 TaxID=2692198 RepID=UPI0013FEE06D|nr:WhiB family transcriptional regulator [Streptomyces sp. HUCO-GS316]
MSAVPHFLDGLPDRHSQTPCREYPFLFVDASRRTPLKENVEEAKRLCATCPVKDACLTHAIANNEQDGVWGGLTPDERLTHASTLETPI